MILSNNNNINKAKVKLILPAKIEYHLYARRGSADDNDYLPAGRVSKGLFYKNYLRRKWCVVLTFAASQNISHTHTGFQY